MLRESGDEEESPQFAELVQRELDADREQQQQCPSFGEQLQLVRGVADQSQTAAADQRSNHQIPDQQRDAEPFANHAGQRTCGQDDQQVAK
ncbi:MAG: hypothetical protein R3C99_17665 [Pirellulaceae bacterium]